MTPEELRKLRFFLYLRLSSDEIKQAYSIKDQDAWAKQVSRLLGLNIVAVFAEEMSAKAPGRSQFNEMMRRIQAGEANAILVWDYDRLARNPIDDGLLRWLLQQGVIKCIYTSREVYTPESNSILMSVKGGMSTQYVRDLSHNVRRRKEKAREAGEWTNGSAPYGYDKDKATKHLVPNPQEADIYREALKRYVAGESKPSILRDFRTRGIADVTHEMLCNWTGEAALLTCLGHIFYDQDNPVVVCQDAHPATISLELADDVRARRGRERQKHAPRSPRSDKKIQTILDEIHIQCPACAGSMTARQGGQPKRGEPSLTLKCRRNIGCKNCISVYCVEDIVRRWLSDYSNPTRFAELLIEVRKQLTQDVITRRVDALVAKERSLTKQIDNLLDQLSRIPVEVSAELQAKLRRLSDEREIVRRELAEKRAAKLDDIDAAEVAAALRKLVDGIDPEDKAAMAALLRRLIQKIVITPKERVEGGWIRSVIFHSDYAAISQLSRVLTDEGTSQKRRVHQKDAPTRALL